MAYKTLIFGTDDLYGKLKPFYEKQVELGNLEIVATAELQKDSVNITYVDGIPGGGCFVLRPRDSFFQKTFL